MALVNPNIAMSYRAPEIQQPNMLADYAAIQQIQGGRQAQEMNALKMQEAQAALAERNALRQLNPAAADYENQLFRVNPTLGIAYRKEAATTAAQQAATKLSEAKTAEASLDTNRKKLKYAWESVGDASTPDLAIQKIADGMTSGVFSQQDGAAEIQQLQGMTPELFRQYRINKISQILDAKDKFGAMLPKIARQEAGGQIVSIQDNPALPGYGLPVTGVAPIVKTETFADVNARKRLEFDKAKEAWQRANPGFEIREGDDGTTYGVNKNTLQAFPVTIGGGAAPAAAPAAGGTGMPSARVPAPLASLAGATPTAARPLMGKGQAMTETQSNAATFGGAMMQAQSTINQLEKTGTVTNAVVPGLLTGLAKLVPLGVGENLGNVIQSTFNADPTGLIGPNANQQRLAQAQLAFSIAYLRKTSGAAFGATEVSNTIQEYFPVIGDSDQVIAQKAAARKRAIDGMRISTNAEGKKYIDSFSGGGGEWKVVK